MKIRIIFGTFFFVLICVCSNAIAQQNDYVVDSVAVMKSTEGEYAAYIPRVRDSSNSSSVVAGRINTSILERFMLESYDEVKEDDFNWSEIEFGYSISSNILLLSFSAEYYAVYPNMVFDQMYFDLYTGEEIQNQDIVFQSLFTLEGYLDFLNTHWKDGVKAAFNEATACSDGTEPYCSYYDIYEYRFKDGKLSASLADDCYPRVLRGCSPSHDLALSLDELKPYLSPIGFKILVEDGYTQMRGIQKLLYNQKMRRYLPNNVFLFGKIDNKYPFSMGLNISSFNDEINGYYFYDRKLQKLNLKGKKSTNTLILEEVYKGKVTGYFDFIWYDDYKDDALSIYSPYGKDTYLKGVWLNPDKSQQYDIVFTEVKFNDRN